MRLVTSLLFAAFAIFFLPATASLAAFPEKPVRVVVGFAPGGGVDTLSRLVAPKVAERWGQSVIVENQAGADSTIAADAVAHAKPDGYTLMMVTTNHTVAPAEFKVNYDPIKSFTPIVELASQPDLLVVNPNLPVQSLKDLLALAKSKPGELNFASTGASTSSFLEMSLLTNLTGMKMVNVTYKGGAPAMAAVIGGEVQMMFGSLSTFLAQVKAGKLRALAVASPTRLSILPDVPTVAEAAGLSDFSGGPWYGLLGPLGMPRDLISKIHDDFVAAIRLPDVQDSLKAQSFVTLATSPEEFAGALNTDAARWAPILKTIEIH